MRKFLSLIGVAVFALSAANAGKALADDAGDKYLAIPGLTPEQKAKIEAIETKADAEIQELLTDSQKATLTAKKAPALAPIAEGKGLYGGDAAAVTTGPVKGRDYWQAKFNAEQLEEAIKSKQPEGAIGMHLISDIQLLNDLQKKYPKHEEVKAWKERALAVQKQIGDNFNRGDSFKKGCLLNEDSYMQAYVCYNTARMDVEEKDYQDAQGFLHISSQKFDWLLADDAHMDEYPESAKKWVRETAPKNKELADLCRAKMNH